MQDTNTSEVDLVIEVSGGDCLDLMDFLKSHGIRGRPHYGVFNGPLPDESSVGEMLKHPAPYIWVTAAGHLLICALKAYVQSKKKRIIIHRCKTGLKVDATNWSADQLKDLGVLDLVRLESDKGTENLN